MPEEGNIFVVAGIDSGIGKTVATGLLARWFKDTGSTAITMKMVQTGGSDFSDDIVAHRKLASQEMVEEDALGLTCPYIFSVACSPHLAARLDGRPIDPEVIVDAAKQLAGVYPIVLLEAVGGLFTPLGDDICVIDLIQQCSWPVILVTGPRPGSINHTIAALEALDNRGVALQGLIYNLNGSRSTDPRIIDDSRRLYSDRVSDFGWSSRICDIPDVSCTATFCVDFSELFS